MDWISHELRRMDRRQIRAEVQASNGIYLNDGDSVEEEQQASARDEADEAVWIRVVKRERVEGEESEMEKVEVDAEVDDGYDYDMEDDYAANGEESEESEFETDYGSLNVIQEKD